MLITLLSPESESEISLQSPSQKFFLENIEQFVQDTNWRTRVPASKAEMSAPQPVRFSWETDDGEDAMFCLSDTEDFSNILYEGKGVKHLGTYHLELYNLEIGKKYYWCVGNSRRQSFKTKRDLPRFIYAEGARNIRDLGGYDTIYGRRVKQGMIYRGSELNGSTNITENGVRVLREDLGIVYDLDLRMVNEGGCVYCSPLGEDIGYTRMHTHSYVDYLKNQAHSAFLMRFFATNDAYPLYLHCASGDDVSSLECEYTHFYNDHPCYGGYARSATAAMMLLAVLGVSDEDILRDFEATSLAEQIPVSRHSQNDRERGFFDTILGHQYGNTFHESICSYLRMCGITDDMMDAFREKMLEK